MSRILETSAHVNKAMLKGPWRMHCYSCCSLVEFLISDRDRQGCYVCPACGHAMSAIGIEKDEWVVR